MLTVARGSSDHAATYLKYAVELTAGIPVASVGPSVASVYGRSLRLSGAAYKIESQARFSSVPPSWREYLNFPPPTFDRTSLVSALVPRSDEEERVWKLAVREGWQQGVEQANLMQPMPDWLPKFDVIFLRNVLIYFEKSDQEAVIRRLVGHLRPGGYLLLGHSESMIGTSVSMRQTAPAVFQKL